jgi:hypothetical protein
MMMALLGGWAELIDREDVPGRGGNFHVIALSRNEGLTPYR